jgi:sugar (pentulose or hexulose) kinase
VPLEAQVSRTVGNGFLVEAGLSAAGAALDWLSGVTGSPRDELVAAASTVAAGANGVFAFPWLHGARAPWWRADVHGAFLGVATAHGPADLARAVIEGVALDTIRSVELLAPQVKSLQLAGGGAAEPLWRSILAAVARCPLIVRRHGEAASVGARALIAQACADPLPIEQVNPVLVVESADPELQETYRSIRRSADSLAASLMSTRP